MHSPQAHSDPVAAIVVAAGSGSRLGSSLPKALVPLAGIPLVSRAVDALRAGGIADVVVMAPADYLERFVALWEADSRVCVVAGGTQRQDSVRLGLEALPEASRWVLVHDAARPLVPAPIVRAVVEALEAGARAVVPVVPVVDSIRCLESNEHSVVVDRARLRAVQTPQGFDLALLRQAHRKILLDGLQVTDDAAACELLGEKIVLVAGDKLAMKITEPFDLRVAEAICVAEGSFA